MKSDGKGTGANIVLNWAFTIVTNVGLFSDIDIFLELKAESEHCHCIANQLSGNINGYMTGATLLLFQKKKSANILIQTCI